jgi:hypothetical protein
MEVNAHLLAPASLPPIPNAYEAVYAPGDLDTWQREKAYFCHKFNPGHAAQRQ